MLVHKNGPIPKGRHIVPITVKDNQGLPGNGNLSIKAIECQDNENVADCKTVAPIGGGLSAGAIAGILAGLLGLLLLGKCYKDELLNIKHGVRSSYTSRLDGFDVI